MKIILPLLVLLSSAPVFAVPLSVSVVDDKGKPVASADVQFESFGKTPRGFVLSQTNEQGTVTFDVEPRPNAIYGKFAGRVFARKNGYAIADGRLFFQTPLKIELGASAKISGKIVDPEGKPIQGAAISFLSAQRTGEYSEMLIEGPLLPQMTAHSAADGSWQLDGVPADVSVYVKVSAPERVGLRTQILAGGSAQTTLQPGAQIKGRLLGLDGQPLPNIHVSAQSTNNSPNYSGGGGKTAADGTFLLDGLSSGTFNVMFYSEEEEAPFVIPSFEGVSASVGKPLQLPDARAVEGIFISGHVRDSVTKEPVTKVEIGVYGGVNPASSAAVSSTSVDENGAWKTRTLPGQSKIYLMGIPVEFKQDQQTRNMTLGEAGEQNIDFDLERLPKITGRLLDEEGNGVKASLQLRRDKDVFWAASDEKGDFTSYGPTPGEWQISISDGRWEPESPKQAWELAGPARVNIAADKPLEVRVRAITLGTLELGVYDDDDVAVEGARIAISIMSGEGMNAMGRGQELVTDKTGRARFEGLRANESVQIQSALKQGYDTAPLPTPAHVGRTWNAAITLLKRSGSASGQVFATDGQTASGALVSGSGVDVRADDKGYYALSSLPKGITPVFAWKENSFALASSDKTRLDLQPQTLEPTDPAKARAILAALAEQAKDVEYYKSDSLNYEIGSFDELALKFQQTPAKGAITTLLSRFGRDKNIPAASWFEVLQSEKDAGQRLYYIGQWLKLGPSIEADGTSRAFLESLERDVTQTETQFKADASWQTGQGIFAAAAFAEKIGETQKADDLFERARLFTNNADKGSTDRSLGIIGGIVAVSPRFLEKTAALIPDTNSNHFLVLRDGVPVLARSAGLDAVKPFLAQMQTPPPQKPDSYGDTASVAYMWYETVVSTINAGGKTDPPLSLELAKSLPTAGQFANYDARDTALCEAAFFQSPEAAKQLWRESLPRLQPDKAMRFAVRILKIDEPFAREQYETLARNMDASLVPDPNTMWSWNTTSPAAFAFYEARFNPARARFRLERAFAIDQTLADDRRDVASYARAMALFDANRAVAWSGRSPGAINDWHGNFETRRRIAQWLVLGEQERENAVFPSFY